MYQRLSQRGNPLMAFAAHQSSSIPFDYVSKLVNTPSTQCGYIGPVIAGLDRPEWFNLYERDPAFSGFVNDLVSLSYESDESPPSAAVIDWVVESSVLAKKLLAQDWKQPHVTSDDSGGVRVSWREGNKEVRAIVPISLERRYLYWQDGAEYGGSPNFGSATLYSFLSRMNEPVR
jgi:hypothetical protein